ncbi:unnamed protein product, partial [Oppiella nova]
MTYSLVIYLVLLFRRFGYRHPSSVPLQWFTNILVVTINLYQFFIIYDKNIPILEAVLNCLELFLTIIALIISCLTTRYSDFEELGAECEPKCPMNDFNVFSKIFIIWMKTLLKHGYKSTADLTPHLLPVCDYMKSLHAFNAFESADSKYNSNRLKSEIIWTSCVTAGALVLCKVAADFIQTYILAKLIDFVSDSDHMWHGVCYAIAYCLFNLMSRLFDCHSILLTILGSYRVSSSLTIAIYKKMLRLSAGSRRTFTTGEINNIMSVDVMTICDFIRVMTNLYTIPLLFIIGEYFLWQQLGPSSLMVFAVMAVVLPWTTFISKRIEKIQAKQMELKDTRIKQISEVLSNIKLLKLFGWEKPFMDRISKTRHQELHELKIFNYFYAIIYVCWMAVPFIMAGITFTVYLHTSVHFILFHSSYCLVSTNSSEELDESVERDERSDDSSDERYAVSLKKCCFSWSLEEEPILKDITLNVKKGSLVAIVGRVGSGKSSLFSALMGDMYQTGGSRSAMRGSVSYVPQSAWIQNMSLRQNIVFVSDYDRGKYERVVKACALDTDFNSLPAKDLTEIGEKGINLSGGQKHRVSLARAVYHGSDIYLLDDPLAAVDAHVGQHLFERIIGPKGLLRNTTRILATHHMEFLREADHILVLSEGRVVESGGYDELAERG